MTTVPEDMADKSGRAVRPINFKDELSTLAHDTRRFIDVAGAVATYLKLMNLGVISGLPREFEEWIEQLMKAAHNLRDALENCTSSWFRQKESIRESDLEELLSNLLSEAQIASNIIRDKAASLASIDTGTVEGLPHDFSSWVQWLYRITDEFCSELDAYVTQGQ